MGEGEQEGTKFWYAPLNIVFYSMLKEESKPEFRGLISSTVLTLLVVPLLYTLLDDLAQLVKRLVAGALVSP